MKNASPGRIVFISTLTIIGGLFLLETIALLFPAVNVPVYHWLIVPVLTGALTYFVLYQAVENFIYRKIKLIYKKIHALKSTKGMADEVMRVADDPISEVNKEVIEWAKTQATIISTLQQQEKFRRDFLGNVSHELKTPIMSIQGYLESLQDGGIEDPNINATYIDRALKNVDRMIMIIDDLTEISALESGELQLQKRKFDVCRLVKEVFELLEMQADQVRTSLVIKDGCDAVFQVVADEKRIREVLINLIGNAIKYGKIQGKVQVGIYNMGDHILVEVSDNGPGIALEHLSRVFERFYRIDKSRSRDQGGTGLGLAIVKHIIEAHAQHVHVRSTEGEGSTFSFTLEKA